MLSLEKRFYPLAEIKELMDTKRKETITNNLTKWDYRYEWIPRKGVNIIETPDMGAPEVQLRSLLIRKLDLDVQVNIQAFAAFFLLLQEDDFLTTPWETRAKIIKERFDIDVSDRVLRTYNSKLVSKNMMIKNGEKKKVWCSFYVSGSKCQEKIDEEDENDAKAMEDWFNKRNQYMIDADIEYSKALGEEGLQNPKRFSLAAHKMWEETKMTYYPVKGWTFNGFNDEDIREIVRLSSLVLAGIEPKEDEIEEIVEREVSYNPLDFCTGANGEFIW